MKNLLTIILVFIFSVLSGQTADINYGPNIGLVSNTEKFQSNTLQFGFSIRRIYKWRYVQPELNLIFDPQTSEFSQMKIPILFGIRTFKIIRFGIGAELGSNLLFSSKSTKGLNQLSYYPTPTYVSPIAGVGIDIGRMCLDFRVSSQFNISVGFLFGRKK